jgi:hypothetical protein
VHREGPSSFEANPASQFPQVDPDTLTAAFELYRNYANTHPTKVAESREAVELASKAGEVLQR